MKRDALEKTTASLVVILISVFTLGMILMVANLMFEWHIFPPSIEKFIYFLSIVVLLITVASAAVNIMLNISRLAFFSEKIAQHIITKYNHE